jgi:alkylated DNA repair dioxygenase AlkB
MRMQQADLFGKPTTLPLGFRYEPELISRAEEQHLLTRFHALEFKPFEFHGFLGKRRVVSFGWRYDFNGGGLQKTEDIPDFLRAVRSEAAAFAGLRPEDLQQVLLTEYRADAAIGWHKDRAAFGDVVGISLLSPCTFRLRRKVAHGWQRAALELEPRSVYLLHGEARTAWEHSIPPVRSPRYSITFRNFRTAGGRNFQCGLGGGSTDRMAKVNSGAAG